MLYDLVLVFSIKIMKYEYAFCKHRSSPFSSGKPHLQPGFPNTTLTLQRSLMKQFCGQGLQQPFPARWEGEGRSPLMETHGKRLLFLTQVLHLILRSIFLGFLRSIVGEAQMYNNEGVFANSVLDLNADP